MIYTPETEGTICYDKLHPGSCAKPLRRGRVTTNNITNSTAINPGTIPVSNAGLQLFQEVKVQGVHLANVQEYLLSPVLGENGSPRQLCRPDGSVDHLRGRGRG